MTKENQYHFTYVMTKAQFYMYGFAVTMFAFASIMFLLTTISNIIYGCK